MPKMTKMKLSANPAGTGELAKYLLQDFPQICYNGVSDRKGKQ